MSRLAKIILWILVIFTGITWLIDLIAIPFYFIEKGVLDGITAIVDLAFITFWEVVYVYALRLDKKTESEDMKCQNCF